MTAHRKFVAVLQSRWADRPNGYRVKRLLFASASTAVLGWASV